MPRRCSRSAGDACGASWDLSARLAPVSLGEVSTTASDERPDNFCSKAISRSLASAATSLFLAPNARVAHTGATSADVRLATSVKSLSRNAADWVASSMEAASFAAVRGLPFPNISVPAGDRCPDEMSSASAPRPSGPRQGASRSSSPANAYRREQGITARIGQGGAHTLWVCHLGNRADRPVGSDPFARAMRKHRCQFHQARYLVNGRGLNGGDLMLTERFAYDIEPARQRCIPKGALRFSRCWRF
jgi:hypothetical protein